MCLVAGIVGAFNDEKLRQVVNIRAIWLWNYRILSGNLLDLRFYNIPLGIWTIYPSSSSSTVTWNLGKSLFAGPDRYLPFHVKRLW